VSHALAQPEQQSSDGGQPRRAVSGAVVAAAAVCALAVGGLGYFLGYQSASNASEEASSVAAAAADAQADARLSNAYETCLPDDTGATVSLSDEGRTVVIDTRSEYGSVSGMQCIVGQLDTPESTIAAISRTTSMMGVQEDDHDGISYSWSYHPDNGLNMVITLDD
jgi:hypothetical protein